MTTARPTSSADAQSVLALLERQQALYQELKALSDQQSQAVSRGAADLLLGILASRQRVIEQLGTVHGDLEPFRRNWEDFIAALDTATRQHATALVRQVKSLLSHIIEQDERDRSALQAARGRVGAELQKLNRTGGAMQAYRGATHAPAAIGIASGDNRFTDQTG